VLLVPAANVLDRALSAAWLCCRVPADGNFHLILLQESEEQAAKIKQVCVL
jgi:hypothetical protein